MNVASICSPSFLRISPVSTKTQVNWVPIGLGHERGGDGGVHAARQRAEHSLGADLRADGRHLVIDDRRVGPRRRDLGHVVQEVLEQFLAALGVRDLGMELHREETTLRRPPSPRPAPTGVDAVTTKPSGARSDGVAVAHPARLRRRATRSISALGPRRVSSVRPYSPPPVWATSPPSCSAMSWAP